MEALSVLAVIGILIFTVINLIIYHKVFTVTYFNLSKGCFTELFYAWIAAMFEVGLIVLLGRTVLSGLLKVLGFAGKLLLIVLAIALAVFVVSKIVQIIKGKSDTEETGKKDVDFVPGNQETDEGKESEGTELHSESETVAEDVKIEETENVYDIELTEAGDNKVKVIRVVRDMTGLGLAEAKDFVESSAKTLKGISGEKADAIRNRLESEGAKVIMRLSQDSKTVTDKKDNIQMVACSSCGKMISENAKFCNFCGKKTAGINTNVCVKCGNPLPLNANFCHLCGEKIRKDS